MRSSQLSRTRDHVAGPLAALGQQRLDQEGRVLGAHLGNGQLEGAGGQFGLG